MDGMNRILTHSPLKRDRNLSAHFHWKWPQLTHFLCLSEENELKEERDESGDALPWDMEKNVCHGGRNFEDVVLKRKSCRTAKEARECST
jgi:hypothetical protein